jgi:hypothetical protein
VNARRARTWALRRRSQLVKPRTPVKNEMHGALIRRLVASREERVLGDRPRGTDLRANNRL